MVILELCAFYIEHKKVKFTAINFRGRNNVKYFMQTQVLQLLKITTKSTHFLPTKKKIQILWIELQTNKIQMSQNLTSKHRAVKNLEIAKTFSKNVDKEATVFQKISYFLLQGSFLSVYLHKSIHKK